MGPGPSGGSGGAGSEVTCALGQSVHGGSGGAGDGAADEAWGVQVGEREGQQVSRQGLGGMPQSGGAVLAGAAVVQVGSVLQGAELLEGVHCAKKARRWRPQARPQR